MAVMDRPVNDLLSYLVKEVDLLRARLTGAESSIWSINAPSQNRDLVWLREQVKADLRTEIQETIFRQSQELERRWATLAQTVRDLIQEESRAEFAVLQEQIEELWTELREREEDP